MYSIIFSPIAGSDWKVLNADLVTFICICGSKLRYHKCEAVLLDCAVMYEKNVNRCE